MRFEKIRGTQNHHLFRPIRDDGSVSDIFWVRFYRQGKGRLEESLKTSHLGEARERRDRRIAEFLGEKPRSAAKHLLVEDKFPEFLELKRGKSANTYKSMEIQWRLHLKPHFGSMRVDEVTETAWLRYVNEKRKADPDRKFFNDRKYLGMFLHWLHRAGDLAKLPRLEDADPEVAAGKVYSTEEIATLIDCSSGDLRLQIQMAATMGMRHGEIWSLEWSQIDWVRKTIHLPAAKTKIRKARTFAMSPLCELLLAARNVESVSPWVFPHPADPERPHGKFGTKNAWEALRAETGIEGRFHDLRHTFLTQAFKKSVNPALICHYAGLSLEEAEKTYLHFDHEDTRVVASLVGISS